MSRIAITACHVVVVLSACEGGAGGVAMDAALADVMPRETVTDSKTLLASELGEATLHGGAGDLARIRLSAPIAKLDWNLHGHTGGGTQTVHEELGIATADYTFAPEAPAEWSLLLRNRDTAPLTVEVHIELYGEITWSGWD
jgi:hypothetical protein